MEDGGAPKPKLGNFVAAADDPKEKDAGEPDLVEVVVVVVVVVVIAGAAVVTADPNENEAGEADFAVAVAEGVAAAKEKEAGDEDLLPAAVATLAATDGALPMGVEAPPDGWANENGDAVFAAAAAPPNEKEADAD